MKYFSTNNFSMSLVGQDDLPLLAQHRNSQDTWNNLTDIFPKYEAGQQEWFNNLGVDKGKLYFIARLINPMTTVVPLPNDPVVYDWDNRIGFIRITDIDFQNGNACIGLDIFERFRGFGFAAPVFNMAIKYGFNYLNLHRLWLLVKEDNTPALKTYRRAGFRTEGKMRQHLYRDGKYYDYIMMGLLRDEWVDSSV